MCRTGEEPGEGTEPTHEQDAAGTVAASCALLEDSAQELYESAPCGYLSTLMDGTIAKINATLLEWLGVDTRQWWAGPASLISSPSAGRRTTKRTSRRCCACRAKCAVPPWR